jgi:hypothetical protein
MTIKSPLSIVKEKFQDKDGLIKAVRELATEELWVDRLDQDKGLDRVSNKKLLRLHAILTEVKTKFGTREKLIAAVADQEKRAKDDGYKIHLGRYSTPRLLDFYKVSTRRAKKAS